MIEHRKDDTDASLAHLVRLAGAREMPSQDATERARAAAHEAWQRGLLIGTEPASLPKRRRWWPLALAASCAWVVFLLMNRPAPLPQIVATVVRVDAQQAAFDTSGERLDPGTPVHEGTGIHTVDGRAAFLLGDALSLRMDRHTQIDFEAPDRVRLLRGNLYVDSGGLNALPRLRIETPAGEVRHLGTQFLITVEPGFTSVRVREGRVTLTPSGEAPRDAGAGDAFEITGREIRFLQDQPSYGETWEWAAATAPSFDIENRPLAEFLTWIAREHGWRLAYADDAVRMQVHDIRLHGSIAGLNAPAMLERIERITGVSLRARDGVLSVGGERVQ